jgi:hypothetical protein
VQRAFREALVESNEYRPRLSPQRGALKRVSDGDLGSWYVGTGSARFDAVRLTFHGSPAAGTPRFPSLRFDCAQRGSTRPGGSSPSQPASVALAMVLRQADLGVENVVGLDVTPESP